MADIFLSYSRHDRPAAEAMARAMAARGWSVWWDRKISAGSSFDEMIEHELESAKCVVVVWSKNSVASDWVKNEAAAAVERGTLIPTMIDSLRLPIEFRRKQTIDLSQWDRTDDDTRLSLLLEAIHERLSGAPPLPTHDERKHRPSLRLSRRALATTAVVGIGGSLLAAGVALWPGETSYALVCKGGGPFGVQTEGLLSARIGFVPAPRQASQAMVPGECAWTDRPLYADEPTEMCYSGLHTRTLAKRFAASELLHQHVYNDSRDRCLRIVTLL